MKISLITVAFNAESTIEDTITSVLGQDFPDIEYIVIDGVSSDATMDIVNKYRESIDMIVSESDEGIYDAMNKGLALATGSLVGFLNADDVYADSQVISKVVRKITDENADALYADLVYVDRDNADKVKRKWISGPYKEGAFLKGWMPPHPTFFLKKEFYLQWGGFNMQLKSAADYELMLRMIHKHAVKLTYLNEVIVKMRLGGESNMSFKNRIRANKEDRLAWKLNDLKPGRFTVLRKPLSKISQFIKR